VSKPIALCLGGALCVWDDLARARALIGDARHIMVACNYAGIQYDGHLDAWVSLHPERMRPWMAERAARGGNSDYRVFGQSRRCNSPGEVISQIWNGSSGLYAAQIALRVLGCGAAVLCGVPMESAAQHIHWPGDWTDPDKYRAGFEQARAEGANIRSMSGWTRTLFGAPSRRWIQS